MTRLDQAVFVYPRLPSRGFGLANMMFVWGRAVVAGMRHGLPMLAPNWFKPLRIGPWLRGERDKRYYFRDFTNSGYLKGWLRYRMLWGARRLPEEALGQALSDGRGRCVVVFDGLHGYFRPILGYHEALRDELLRIVAPGIQSAVAQSASEDYIGIHVRRGDFVPLGQAIPVEWYAHTACSVRAEWGDDLPIRIFSDGTPEELTPLLALHDAHLMPRAPAIQDLLLLSNARVILGTSLSTFSLWASFLGGGPTIWPPISPGVYGYGLHTPTHIATDWNGRLDRSVMFY